MCAHTGETGAQNTSPGSSSSTETAAFPPRSSSRMWHVSDESVSSYLTPHCITVRITMWELYFHARLVGGMGNWGSRLFSLCGSKMVTLSSCSAAKSLFRLWHTPSSALLRNVCYIFTITVCFLFCFFQIFCESFVEWVATFCIFRITLSIIFGSHVNSELQFNS